MMIYLIQDKYVPNNKCEKSNMAKHLAQSEVPMQYTMLWEKEKYSSVVAVYSE